MSILPLDKFRKKPKITGHSWSFVVRQANSVQCRDDGVVATALHSIRFLCSRPLKDE